MVDNNLQESPEQKTTRNSLGKGATVLIQHISQTCQIDDNALAEWTPDLTANANGSVGFGWLAPSSGIFKKIFLLLLTNTLSGDLTLKLMKNGIDQIGESQIISPSDLGSKILDFEGEFDSNDVLSITTSGNGFSNDITFVPGTLVIEYDN